jgi:hypothetical protein
MAAQKTTKRGRPRIAKPAQALPIDDQYSPLNIRRRPPQPDKQAVKDAYSTRCNGCPSMLMLPQPWNHCPKCHHRWMSRGLDAPIRCTACRFNLFNWRRKNNIPDRSNTVALIA